MIIDSAPKNGCGCMCLHEELGNVNIAPELAASTWVNESLVVHVESPVFAPPIPELA